MRPNLRWSADILTPVLSAAPELGAPELPPGADRQVRWFDQLSKDSVLVFPSQICRLLYMYIWGGQIPS